MKAVRARLLPWLTSLGLHSHEIEPLRGDVSPRRYFRLTGSGVIVAMYPLESAMEVDRFVATTQEFETAGVRVPRIHASDSERGLLLLEDLGHLSLFDLIERDWNSIEIWFRQAIGITRALADRPPAALARLNPPLDGLRLEAELAGAFELFLAEPEFSGSPDDLQAIRSALKSVCRAIASEPLVPSHRDFMSRNLMLTGGESELVVIDHQDACLAPRFYDLASLLNDSFFPGTDVERELLRLVAENQNDIESYRACAVQRTIKACSTFVRFARLGHKRHLPLVAPTLSRAARHLERIPAGAGVPAVVLDHWRDESKVAAGLRRLANRGEDRSASRSGGDTGKAAPEC